MTTSAAEPEVVDGTLVPDDDLTRRTPIIDRLQPRQRELLFLKHGMREQEDGRWVGKNGLSVTDIASMLETAGMYGLDPFAQGEIWVARSSPDNLLLMTGRNGLRKIAQRNGLEVRRDVVYSSDEFVVRWLPDRTCEIEHSWSLRDRADEDVKIVGAWSEVWERESGRQRGFFYAPLSEYMPNTPSSYSPWRHQVSAMILGASERQSIGQATPLGGLIFEGEAERNFEARPVPQLAEGTGDGSEPGWGDTPQAIRDQVEDIMSRAAHLGHGALANRASVQQIVKGMDGEDLAAWLRDATESLDALKASREQAEPAVEGTAVEEPQERQEPQASPAEPTFPQATGESDVPSTWPGAPPSVTDPANAKVVETPAAEYGEERCRAVDKASGQRCRGPFGHEGFHEADGLGWDAFLPEQEAPAPAAGPVTPPAQPPSPQAPDAPEAAPQAPEARPKRKRATPSPQQHTITVPAQAEAPEQAPAAPADDPEEELDLFGDGDNV